MANILICWELGSGWGHVGVLRPLARELLSRGYRVTLAARELGRAAPTFAGMNVRVLQAPCLPPRPKLPFERVECFAHVLANVGYDDPSNLVAMVAGWRGLFELVRPDLVVAEYAPTALLALRGTGVPRAAMGTGFSLPPDVTPLPALVGLGRSTPPRQQVERDEAAVLRSVNQALRAWRGRPMERLANLFHDEVAATVLRTYEELDPFAPRPGIRYGGTWPSEGGDPPLWPAGNGPKVFVYLRQCPARDALLAELRRLGTPTLVAPEGFAAPGEAERTEGPNLRVARRPLDITRVAATCDLGVLNGGHNALAAMLLASRPCLLLPQHLEQHLIARQAKAIECAAIAAAHDAPAALATLQHMIGSRSFAAAAARFATRHATRSGVIALAGVAGELERATVPTLPMRW